MKKIIVFALLIAMLATLAACTASNENNSSAPESSTASSEAESSVDSSVDSSVESSEETSDDSSAADDVVMSYEEYMAADMQSEVVVETYVQAHQSWWDNKITVYCQSPDGAYFVYELACTEEDAAKLVPGTKIRVTGFKGEWEGEVEIMDGTFEFVEGGDSFIAEAFDATALLGTDDLIKHQNEFVIFKGMTVEAIAYKNDAPGDDIYLTFGKDGASYEFCVEIYLTGEDSDVYKTVADLKVGDVVDVECFLYWYQGANPHVTSIKVAE